jgi:hypothetical protein
MPYRNQTQAEFDQIVKEQNDKYANEVKAFGNVIEYVKGLDGVKFNHGCRISFSFSILNVNYYLTWKHTEHCILEVHGKVNGKKIPKMYYYGFDLLQKDIKKLTL